jgi:hypothetical protein
LNTTWGQADRFDADPAFRRQGLILEGDVSAEDVPEDDADVIQPRPELRRSGFQAGVRIQRE